MIARVMVATLLLLSVASAAEAEGKGWATITLSDWRRLSDQYRGGMVIGAMNAAAMLGAVCEMPISATMVQATLLANYEDGPARELRSDMLIAEAVWRAMGAYHRCAFPPKGT